ncbi:MAG: alpha/beta hydrolase [Actinomycetota bacterium]
MAGDPSSGLRWRGMTGAERERAYSPSSCLADGDYRPFVEAYRNRSDAAWSAVHAMSDVRVDQLRYGDGPANTVDVAVPVGDRQPPLLVYLHGGYWQELSKLDSRFAAADCIRRGWGFAAVDYTLAPEASVPAIVEECRRSIATLRSNVATLGFDPARLVVAGSSAGAHLAAMVCLDAEPAIAGAVLVSGIFELEPLIGTSINEALGLDADAARRNSPLLADRARLAAAPPTVIAHGQYETAEFKAQSRAFAARLGPSGRAGTPIEIVGRNHFDVILDLAAPETTLGAAVAALVAATATA